MVASRSVHRRAAADGQILFSTDGHGSQGPRFLKPTNLSGSEGSSFASALSTVQLQPQPHPHVALFFVMTLISIAVPVVVLSTLRNLLSAARPR